MDGRANQLVERFGGLEVEVLVLRVADEEPAPFEPPGDASADGVQQPGEFGGSRAWRAVKCRLRSIECVGAVEKKHVEVDVQVERRTAR